MPEPGRISELTTATSQPRIFGRPVLYTLHLFERCEWLILRLSFLFTKGGEVKISYHVYKLSFLNFLLGKQPNGPGQFIFGTVEPQTSTCMFPIDFSAMNATEEDIEPYK